SASHIVFHAGLMNIPTNQPPLSFGSSEGKEKKNEMDKFLE
ncbi:11161_t:CDS:1, partial [Acaulospora morrowiae]